MPFQNAHVGRLQLASVDWAVGLRAVLLYSVFPEICACFLALFTPKALLERLVLLKALRVDGGDVAVEFGEDLLAVRAPFLRVRLLIALIVVGGDVMLLHIALACPSVGRSCAAGACERSSDPRYRSHGRTYSPCMGFGGESLRCGREARHSC
ncbi:C2H2-type zinc finger [Carpediemonas membranifera]|uniref:C2H2-type zinc finger n=1 Tax=Carpediemonas membranifera TaxID=201153 RepID=A0A8J6AZJ6_9EUKA|nr:C2H2-type zinc finger [Carpediemonas membranifera]|eukprot:KAG9389747.1 C2H2-type zinc finger [Carpediemonas membranifera]